MQETKKNTTMRANVTRKPSLFQGGVAGFFAQIFDLPAGWTNRRNIAKNNFDLGVQQFRMGNTADAVFRFKVATWLNPQHAASWYWLGRSFLSEGKPAQAVKALNKATKLKPGDELIGYIMAVALGEKAPERLTPKRVPPELIREYFNGVAPAYNVDVKVEDRTEHIQVAKAALNAAQKGRVNHTVLDLGVGTGLCGVQLRAVSSYITGVDIAPAMLEQAKALRDENERGLYDKLILREAMDFLQDVTDQSYDMVLASGFVHYAGDLQPLFTQILRCLKPGGQFVVTAHAAKKGPFHFNSEMEVFVYAKDYLESCASQQGYSHVDVQQASLATGQEGWLGTFTK